MKRLGCVLLAMTTVACSPFAETHVPETASAHQPAPSGGGGAPPSAESAGDKAPPAFVEVGPDGAAGVLGGTAGELAGGSPGAESAGMSNQGGGPAPAEPSCARIATAPGDFNPCGPTNGIAYSPDGKLLAIATASRPPNVHVYRVSDGSLVHALDGIGDQAYAVAFSADNSVLAVAGQRQDSANDQSDIVKLYDARSGSQLRALPASCGFYADSVAFSLDGTLIATAGFKGPIEIWRVSDGTQVTSIAYPTSVHNVHFAPKGSEIIVGGVDQRATVWAVPSGKKILELSPTTNEQSDATFAPDGAQIATTGPNNDIQVWDTASSKLLQRISAHTAYVAHVLWLDQDHIVSNDWFGTIKWMSRQSSGDFVVSASWSTGTHSLGIAIAPDGKMLAAGGGDGSNSGFKFFAIDKNSL